MKGNVLDFSVQTNSGIISGDDQNRYMFAGTDWRGENAPKSGDRVDFDIDLDGDAILVFNALGETQIQQNISDQFNKISDPNKTEDQFNMIDWFIKCLKNYTNFTGRARRKEYWFFTLVQFIVLIIASIIDSILSTNMLFYSLLALALLIPSLAVAARRLHDTSRSGWLILIALIPLVGGILLLVWLATETKPENNKWGAPAK